MKHFNMVLTALGLTAVLFFIVIAGPVVREEVLSDGQSEKLTMAEGGSGASTEASAGDEARDDLQESDSEHGDAEDSVYGFNLKYDRYLIEAPYTYQVNGEGRCFQFDVMREKIAVVENALKEYRLTYIDNYKNQNGQAPYYKGGSVDALGNQRSAAAPAYADITNSEEFIYLTDGTLVSVLEEDDDYTLISVVGTDSEYSVPSHYVSTDDCLISVEKAIIVDRKNQNIATFEKERLTESDSDENFLWNVTSYSLATTGKEGKYHQPTPLGYFYAIEKKSRFFYVKDGTNEIEGYAPYAVRFSAGAYIHGVSTPYKYGADGTRTDAGIQEFSNSIGTVPLSHKCVRNYTSHAKFVYDWYEHGKTVVIVIE